MGKVIPTLTNTTYITTIFASKLPQNYLKTASKLLDLQWKVGRLIYKVTIFDQSEDEKLLVC